MAFVPTILPALDQIRAIGGLLGLRVYTVFIRTRRFSGPRVGAGTFVDNAGGPDVQLTDGTPPVGPQPVRVRMVSNKDIIASGGLYRDRDLKVGPITPSYLATIFPAGGFGDSTIDPPQVGSVPTEVFWIVFGPGMAPNGSVCEKIQEEVTALHYNVVLRAKGSQT